MVCLVVIGFLAVPITGYAWFSDFIGDDDPDWEEVMNGEEITEQGGIEVESERFPIDAYAVNNESAENTILGAVVSLANMVMTFNAYVVHGVDTVLNELFSLNPIERFSGMVNLVSQSIYDTLQEYFGQLFFIFAVGYIVYLAATKGTFQEAIRRSVLFVFVLVFAGFWMLNSGYFMQVFNSLSLEAQGYLIEAGNGMISNVDGDGVFEQGTEIDREDPMEGTIAQIRNVYFDLSLKRPYLIVNYGEMTEEEVNSNDVSDIEDIESYGGGNFDRYERMLAFDQTGDGQYLKQRYIENIETESDQLANASMGGGAVYTQLGQALVGLIVALFLALPFGALGLLNFGLQLVALGLAFFLPFSLIISYIPHFANSGFNVFMKLLTVFVVKAMIGIIIMFVYLLTFVVDTMLPPDTFGMYLANVVVLIAILLVMIWKRDAIVKLVTAGRVQSLDKNFLNNVNRNMVNPAMDKAAKGMSMVSPTGGAALNKFNQARNNAVRQPNGIQPQGNKQSPETVNHSQQSERTPQNENVQPKNSPPNESNPTNQEQYRKKERKPQKKKRKKGKNNDEPANFNVRLNELSGDGMQQKISKSYKNREKQNRKSEAPPPSRGNEKGNKDFERRRKKEKRESKPMKENQLREKPKRQSQTNEV